MVFIITCALINFGTKLIFTKNKTNSTFVFTNKCASGKYFYVGKNNPWPPFIFLSFLPFSGFFLWKKKKQNPKKKVVERKQPSLTFLVRLGQPIGSPPSRPFSPQPSILLLPCLLLRTKACLARDQSTTTPAPPLILSFSLL